MINDNCAIFQGAKYVHIYTAGDSLRLCFGTVSRHTDK